MNKKGINEVVVVVLIVLLSLVAITLVWVFVRTSINTTGEQVDKGLIFQTVRFSIIPNTVDTSGGNINFTLERNAGAGKISGFLIVLEDQTGNSSIVRTYERTAMEELGRIKVSILKTTHGLSGNVTKISVFPTVVDSGGELISSDSPSTQYTIPTSGATSSSGGGSPPPPAGPIILTSCGVLLNQPGMRYVLNSFNAPSGFTGNCLTVTANDIIIENSSSGMAILGTNNPENGVGIFAQGISGLVVRNIQINGFGKGIVLRQTGSSLITHSYVDFNIQNIVLDSSSNNKIFNVTSYNVGLAGLYGVNITGSSSNNNLTLVTSCSNDWDIVCEGSSSGNFGTGNKAESVDDSTTCTGIVYTSC